LYACDFFTVETLGAFGTVRFTVFFVMELKSHAVGIAALHVDPNGAWLMQLARNLLDPVDASSATRPISSIIAPALYKGMDNDLARGRRPRANSAQ
jgi:hypothetical protein